MMARFKFDHFIHFVESPEKAIEALNALGLHAVEGGRHEHHGTYNALSYYGLSYIELIGVFDKSLVEDKAEYDYSLRATIVASDYQQGGARIALRSTDLEKDAERFRSLGLDVVGPAPLSRTRSDGSVVSWKLLFVGKPGINPELPFFIEWDEADDERFADLKSRGTISEHPLGEVTLQSVGILTRNLENVVETWSQYLDLEIGESFIDETLNAKAQTLFLEGGNIVFYEPLGEGKAKDKLLSHGEKPFLIEFNNSKENKDVEVFDTIYRFVK